MQRFDVSIKTTFVGFRGISLIFAESCHPSKRNNLLNEMQFIGMLKKKEPRIFELFENEI